MKGDDAMMIRPHRRLWIVPAFLALLVVAGPAADSGSGRSRRSSGEEGGRWFLLTMGGNPAGSFRETIAAEGMGTRTESAMKIVLNRMGSRIEMFMQGSFLEGADGRLIEAESRTQTSAQAMRVAVKVDGAAVRLTSDAGGTPFEKSVSPPEPLLGPRGVAALTAARLKAPGDRISYTVFSPEAGAIAVVSRVLEAVETIEVMGRPMASFRITESIEGLPVPTTQWLDDSGALIRMVSPGPFGEIGTQLCGRDEALRAETVGDLPAEIYASSLARTQVRIPSPRRMESLTVEITHRSPDLGWPDFTGPGQEVLERSRDRLVLKVTRSAPGAKAAIPASRGASNAIYLQPNAWIQPEDPGIAATARSVVGEERDLYRAAKMLERWVAEHMTFDLGVVLAPSLEVFEKRRGTCIGYATLLATLARAVGIPSRIIMGYVYTGGIFGGHAWTEVLAGDDWIPLDAAVVSEGPADAARIAFQRTSLEEGIARLSAGPAMQVYGHIDVRVMEYRVEGRPPRQVQHGEALYRIEGDLYEDAALGVALEKPRRFVFTELDRVWPDRTLVGLQGPDGSRASLRQHPLSYYEDREQVMITRLEEAVPGGIRRPAMSVCGRHATVLEAPGRAALAVPSDGEIWILVAEGKDAAGVLREIAGGLRLHAGGRAG
jgi:transglutaminase-like putative cysteine protease